MPELTITESELADALRILSITNYPERDANRIMHVLGGIARGGPDEADIALTRLYGRWVWGRDER